MKSRRGTLNTMFLGATQPPGYLLEAIENKDVHICDRTLTYVNAGFVIA